MSKDGKWNGTGDSSVGRVRRGAQLGTVAVRHAVRSATSAAAAPFRDEAATRAAHDAAILGLADDLVIVLGGMRGAAMKLGQLLAVVDIGLASKKAHEEFAARLQPLFAAAPKWNEGAMMALLASELGDRRSRIVSLEGPIAAASIGQVYRGTLDDGTVVAVKIQYPRVDRMVNADLKNLRLLVRVLGKHMPTANAKALVDEVAVQVAAELDFGSEMRNQQYFADRFAGHPSIRIPRPIADLCSDRVLVAEFLEGAPLDSAYSAAPGLRNRLGEAVYRFYCGEMYETGRFCADPHPGNVLVLNDGRVGFVDFGMCVELTPEQHQFEREMFRATLEGDWTAAHRIAVESGFIQRPESMGPDDFADYANEVVGWHVSDAEPEITPERARRAAVSAFMPDGGFWDRLAGQTMQEAHALGRRNELATCALLGRLRATAPWSAIAREILGMAPPATSMGRQITDWRNA